MYKLNVGYAQIYTGNGKGKTTAALGQPPRTAGSGFSSIIIQFMKAPCGELEAAKLLKNLITIEQHGRTGKSTINRPASGYQLFY